MFVFIHICMKTLKTLVNEISNIEHDIQMPQGDVKGQLPLFPEQPSKNRIAEILRSLLGKFLGPSVETSDMPRTREEEQPVEKPTRRFGRQDADTPAATRKPRRFGRDDIEDLISDKTKEIEPPPAPKTKTNSQFSRDTNPIFYKPYDPPTNSTGSGTY